MEPSEVVFDGVTYYLANMAYDQLANLLDDIRLRLSALRHDGINGTMHLSDDELESELIWLQGAVEGWLFPNGVEV